MARVSVQVPVDQAAVQAAHNLSQPPAEQSPTPAANPRQLLTKNNVVIGIVALGVLIVVIIMISLLSDRNKLQDKVNKLSTNQGSSTQSNAQKYQSAVSKLVEVPSGITPVVNVPTQDEITSLAKDNSLYNTAKVGDVFLVYTNQDKSLFLVIYRPSDSKVILAAQASTTTQP